MPLLQASKRKKPRNRFPKPISAIAQSSIVRRTRERSRQTIEFARFGCLGLTGESFNPGRRSSKPVSSLFLVKPLLVLVPLYIHFQTAMEKLLQRIQRGSHIIVILKLKLFLFIVTKQQFTMPYLVPIESNRRPGFNAAFADLRVMQFEIMFVFAQQLFGVGLVHSLCGGLLFLFCSFLHH